METVSRFSVPQVQAQVYQQICPGTLPEGLIPWGKVEPNRQVQWADLSLGAKSEAVGSACLQRYYTIVLEYLARIIQFSFGSYCFLSKK